MHESEQNISNCPFVEALVSGKLKINGTDYRINLTKRGVNFEDTRSQSCALIKALETKEDLSGEEVRCLSCGLAIKFERD